MDWNRIQGNWKRLTGSVKAKWGELTDDEIQEVAGEREKLEGKIQQRYGKSKDQARAEVDEWMARQE
ncbi:MAG TPA: CsbD family protein [Paracoccaceae bacterium]|nr:CsbD family protein [Paracoccaceae bacterium]